MNESTVLLLTFTDQYNWGFSGKNGIFLNSSNNIDDTWHGSLCQVFSHVLRYDIYKGANRGGICTANREIIEIAKTYLPKYVFYPCNFSSIVTEATLIELRRLDCLVIADFFDDDAQFEPFGRWLRSCVDYAVTHVPSLVSEYKKLGFATISTPCIPMNPTIFFNMENILKKYDTTFTGSLYPYRREFLSKLAADGVDVRYSGGGIEKKIPTAEMVKIINQSRINLNFSSGRTGRTIIVGRVFEVPLCGGFLLTEYFPELEKYFDIGREIDCFKSPAEAADKIKYYLEHSGEREQMAARGYERAQHNYTGPAVLTMVVSEIKKDLAMRGRPELVPPATGSNTLRKNDAKEYFKWVRALLKSPPPLRSEWQETARLVIETDPTHRAAARLLKRAMAWGDPEPIIGRLRNEAFRIRSLFFSFSTKLKYFSFASLRNRLKRRNIKD